MSSEKVDSDSQGYGASLADPPECQYVDDVPSAQMSVPKGSRAYKMDHPCRGLCIIFTYDSFETYLKLPSREFSSRDAKKCEATFTKLGFQTEIHRNLSKEEVENSLQAAKQNDIHKNADAFVLIFMSHGSCEASGKELLWTTNDKIDTYALWENFTGKNCTSLAGKPKLFFIQTCRGAQADKGVILKNDLSSLMSKMSNQSLLRVEPLDVAFVEDYRIPSYADILTMWASYPGHYAFNSKRPEIMGSVFIDTLTKTLDEEGSKQPLLDILTEVIRKVAEDYISDDLECHERHKNKQTPFYQTTLTRRLVFWPKIKEN